MSTPMEKPKIKKLTKKKVDEALDGKAVLELTGRGIETMDVHACDGLAAKKLDLSHNKLTRFNFSMTMNLTQLKITSNQLTDSGVADLSFCKALVTLDLSDNKLTRLPGASLRHCTSLKALVLTKNSITTLEWLPSMAQLTSLIVSNNRITEVSEKALGKVKNLVKLSMSAPRFVNSNDSQRSFSSHNKLKALSDTSVLKELSELRISNNQLTALPATLANNRSLKILDACNNAIDTWEGLESLGQLKQLKQLNLKGNPLCGLAADAATDKDEAEKKALDKKNKQYNFKMKRLFETLIIRDGNRILEKRTHGYVAPPKPDPAGKKRKRDDASDKVKKPKSEKSEKKSKSEKVEKKPKVESEEAPKPAEVPVGAEPEKPAKKAKSVAKEDLRSTAEAAVDPKKLKKVRGNKKEKAKFIKESGVLGVVQVKKAKAVKTKTPVDVAQLAATSDIGMGGDSAWD
ncbi:hypothetical protein ACHHYP_00233 [Achlya hypogyna]|uniref:Uncharacterized protein n=1 Tax=Achlya hypogyna TaxID=1202772 RepID=A0A1V9ZAZ7_ACHHY|nr:hypothetical protein ACHHYP_00233 [Achlya hypogyna]